MPEEHDGQMQMELHRQLERVQKRVDEAVARLAMARDGLAVEGLVGPTLTAPPQRPRDLFLLCVRLEVALVESTEAADKLRSGLRE